MWKRKAEVCIVANALYKENGLGKCGRKMKVTEEYWEHGNGVSEIGRKATKEKKNKEIEG